MASSSNIRQAASGGGAFLSSRKSTLYLFLFILLVLLLFGMTMLYSSSYVYGQERQNDGFYYPKMQLRGILIGGFLMLALSFIDYHVWKKLYVVVWVVCMALVLVVFVPGLARGEGGINGAQRWINVPIINMSLQPAEIAKFGLVVFTAALIDQMGPRIKSFQRGILPVLLLVGSVDLVILLQPNFSMFTIIALCTFIMLILGGAKLSQLATLSVIGFIAGFALMMSADYRIVRFKIFTNPFAQEYANQAYQLKQALYALASGGLSGVGFGQSRQKSLFLPYSESDFIFPIIAEELGFFGGVALMLLYLALGFLGYHIALDADDTFGRLTAGGISTVFMLQAFVNIAVTTSSIPTTGVPLPFISYGSTAMMSFLAASGILVSVARGTRGHALRPR